MHETEVGLQAILDPYARGDFFLSFGEEGVELEEGYITFTALPAGFVAEAGKMRSAFGKVNTLHNHALPWVDRPLVTDNLVGGEDGINDAGFSLQRILPAPKGIFLEATGQVFRGDSADVFTASAKSDLSAVAHLRGYKDITESTNLDFGFSYARGHNDSAATSDPALRHRCHHQVETAAPVYLQFIRPPERIYLEPATAQPSGATCFRLLYIRGLPAWAALVLGRTLR